MIVSATRVGSQPPVVPHSFTVGGPGGARLLRLTTPGGVEGFFVELGTPVLDASSPPAEPPDIERLVSVARRYQIEFGEPA